MGRLSLPAAAEKGNLGWERGWRAEVEEAATAEEPPACTGLK